jgi:anti-sigma factor RsiW
MALDEGKLRAYLDRTLPPHELNEIREQLEASLEARLVLARLRQERDEIVPYLAALAPSPAQRADVSQAWRRVRMQLTSPSSPAKTITINERIITMAKQPFMKRYQPALVILAVVAIVAVALSFAPVRAVAGNLLKSFRVQTVRVVPVEKEDLEALRNNPNLKELVDQFEPQVDVSNDGEPQKVDTLEQAANLTGFRVAEIKALPNEADDASISVRLQKIVTLQLDKELLKAVFEAAEIEIDLPDSLDDEPVVVTQPNTVIQEWYQAGEEVLEFSQMTSPAIEYPDGLDLNALGVAGLQLLGMTKDESEALGSTIDWANTMVLPVPNDSDTTVRDVSINGAAGVVFTKPGAEDVTAAILWTRDGMSYFIKGNYSADQLVEMANSVQ